MNKNPLIALLVALITGLAMGSCDTSSDIDYEYSRNCVVTSATLGGLNCTIHTLSSTGADSTYIKKINGANYPLYIDQVNNRIYNADSLPVGTDITKVVFSDFKVTGTSAIRMLAEEEKDTLFAPADSTDFTRPRIITIYSEGGFFKREYTVDIRLHKEVADSLVWQKMSINKTQAIQPFVESRALAVGEQLYVFGRLDNGTSQLVQTSTVTPDFNQSTPLNTPSGKPLDVRSVQYFKNHFYALADGQLVQTETPAGTWTATGATLHFDALAAVSTDSLYAISNQKLYATADGTNWTLSATDTEGVLPTENIAWATQPSLTDPTYECVVMAGQCNGAPSVWKRNIDLSGDFAYPWMYLPQTEELGKVGYPMLQHANLAVYDKKILLAGVTDKGTLAPLYLSHDNGRTWKPGELIRPDVMGIKALCTAVDNQNYLWLICSGTGTVLKGRINRLGWNDEPLEFEKALRNK